MASWRGYGQLYLFIIHLTTPSVTVKLITECLWCLIIRASGSTQLWPDLRHYPKTYRDEFRNTTKIRSHIPPEFWTGYLSITERRICIILSSLSCKETSKILKNGSGKCLHTTGVIPYAVYEESRLKLGCIKGTLEKEMTHVLTGRTCGPGGNLLNAAADACPGAARPVDSSPRCAHICPQITPGLSISPIHPALAEVSLLFWPSIVFCPLRLRRFCSTLAKSKEYGGLSGSIMSLATERPTRLFKKRYIRIFHALNLLKKKRICFIWLSAYRAVNTLHFGYKNQSLNVL
jgi:hypothetical protein